MAGMGSAHHILQQDRLTQDGAIVDARAPVAVAACAHLEIKRTIDLVLLRAEDLHAHTATQGSVDDKKTSARRAGGPSLSAVPCLLRSAPINAQWRSACALCGRRHVADRPSRCPTRAYGHAALHLCRRDSRLVKFLWRRFPGPRTARAFTHRHVTRDELETSSPPPLPPAACRHTQSPPHTCPPPLSHRPPRAITSAACRR